MHSVIQTKTFNPPAICRNEILRYAGCKVSDSETDTLLNSCLNELKGKLIFKVCFCELSLTLNCDDCDFELFSLKSAKLASNLSGCGRVILFAATIGVEIDRLIAKYGRISPAKALMFQAIGAERIEALCDDFCDELVREYDSGLKPRFSPGYGDLPLECQKSIFSILDCGRKLGISLNDSLLISPSKSVTAVVGICPKKD